MKNYLEHDEWSIIENGFHPEHNRVSESIFSLGNGQMGQRANFEEKYSGDTLLGNYVAGVYYPDKTKVGRWKNGYPEYFAKMLNAANWTGINITLDGEELDLANCEVISFRRELNMKDGYLERNFVARTPKGKEVKVATIRFCSMNDVELGAIRYSITPINFDGRLTIEPYVDFDVKNENSNYNEKFWEEVQAEVIPRKAYLVAKTKKLDFHVCTGMKFTIVQNDVKAYFEAKPVHRNNYLSNKVSVLAKVGKETIIYKFGANLSSLNHKKEDLLETCRAKLKAAYLQGFDEVFQEHKAVWADKWAANDIVIEGDIAAQQGIRFNIFQLNQTYSGKDERLNISPKGFTGEKYGGCTYWDTEAYCLPFYMTTADSSVARNLLMYRYKHLPNAIENAEKLGFTNGAALFPTATMNGEESHNEWEIAFEEIHRNGAIAYAIYDYTRYTEDQEYLENYGLEVLIGIARFWAQRVNFSKTKNQYVILGVTGPNQYENNVNNNWYTNYIAAWCLKYTAQIIEKIKTDNSPKWQEIASKTAFKESTELELWQKISSNIHLPKDGNIFIQQDDFLDKEIINTEDLGDHLRPICQNWSWDRILRSCFVKQADVLQGIYFFEEDFSKAEIKQNFDFYEPITVHESSLSPSIHGILAAQLGYEDKAYEMYLRTSRLDLDDYNNDTKDGCHITSMAGSWMAIVKGFAGMKITDKVLNFNPVIPNKWDSYSFKIQFRGSALKLTVATTSITIENLSEKALEFLMFETKYQLKAKQVLVIDQLVTV